jgi:hypothetical protein
MNHKQTKLLFVHIPKNAGTSILSKLDQSMWKKVLCAGHDPLFLLEKNNNIKNSLSFCVVRNPYRRTFSYYIHFKNLNNLDCSFSDFLNIIKKKIFYWNTPMIVFPQSFYVYNLKGIIGIDKIYKYEKLDILEDDLNIKFDRLNFGSYTEKDYEKAYKHEENALAVKNLFSVDFFNFNYDLENLYE